MRIDRISATATEAATDDYLVIAGATNGTRKISASGVGGGGGSSAGTVDVYSGSIVSATDGTYYILAALPFAFTLDDFSIRTSAGTVTASVRVGGAAVAGVDAMSATTTQQTFSPASTETVPSDTVVDMVLSSSASLGNVYWTMIGTRS